LVQTLPMFDLPDIDDSDPDPLPLAEPARCPCFWTFHKGRTCGNVLPVIPAFAGSQLCLPCLFSCEAERQESESDDAERA
jgi:hypothetical protein